MDNYDIIVSAEQQFAREVALGVIYLRTLSAWHYLIPGMFIIDFLRRGSIIRKYTETFMFPRKLALSVARSLAEDQDRESLDSYLVNEIENWLTAHRLDSQDLVRAQKESVDLLIDHYLKLLQADGESYDDLIQHAYSTRRNFEAHLQQIAAAEDKVDQAILVRVGNTPAVKEKLQLEARQVENRRRKILDDIF